MELMEALKTVLELAEQNMLNTSDPELQEEMQKQFNAVESVRLHIQELENPSPLLVEIQHSVVHNYQRAVTNVPARVTYVFGSMVPVNLPTEVIPSHMFLDPKDYE